MVARQTLPEPRTHASKRNLFAYVLEPVAPKTIEHAAIVSAPAVVEAIVSAPPAPKAEAPRFPFRYIGRFGPEHDQIAAFARDGEVITARRGDRVAGFEVRAIGLESVDLVAESGVQRIALASR